MARRDRILKEMNRDSAIHARGFFVAEERDTNTAIFTNARWARVTIEIDREEDQVVERMKELVEAK